MSGIALTPGNARLPGEIVLYAGPPPAGWQICDGTVLNIADHPQLFTLLGDTYGGDGIATFAIPDLRGRLPLQAGQGPGLSNYLLGQKGGAESLTLTVDQLPAHSHSLNATPDPAEESNPAGHILAAEPTGSTALYRNATPTVQLAASSIGSAGNGLPIDLRQPYLPLNFIIWLGQ